MSTVLGVLCAAPATAAQDEPGSALAVYLVTADPGAAIVSRFGHTAIRIQDADSGLDRAYSFAQSDLERPGAFSGLVQGRVEASIGVTEVADLLERYAVEGRTVWIQELRLEPGQRAQLADLLEHPGLGSPASFTYDFFYANCTTKVRDLLDTVLGGQLKSRTADLPSNDTYREHAARLSRSHAPLFFLTNLLLSAAVDRPISVWDEMFLPANLREQVRVLTLVDGEGIAVPLVSAEEVLRAVGGEAPGTTSGPPWLPWLLFGTALGGTLALLGARASGSRSARIGFAVLGGGWSVAVGLLGVLLLALWAFAAQPLVERNLNLLSVSPLSLLVAVWAWGPEGAPRRACALAAAVASLSLLGPILAVIPGFDQDTAVVLALVLPTHVGLVWGLWRSVASGGRLADGPTAASQ